MKNELLPCVIYACVYVRTMHIAHCTSTMYVNTYISCGFLFLKITKGVYELLACVKYVCVYVRTMYNYIVCKYIYKLYS